MCLLVESLKIENRQAQNLAFHNYRFNNAREMKFGITEKVDLADHIIVPEWVDNRVHKCRVVYNHEIHKIEFDLYQARQIQSLKLVYCNEIDYSVKYTDRSLLNKLYAQRGQCDDILIVKNNELTDTFAGNILFYDGQIWFTPTNPLLRGTTRERLLDEGKIEEKLLSPSDINQFSHALVINALLGFEMDRALDTGNII